MFKIDAHIESWIMTLEDVFIESDDHELVESPRAIVPETRKGHAWLERTLKEVEGHVAARGTFGESKKSESYSGYTTLMCKIIKSEPSTYEEAAKEQVWKVAMTEEYQSVLKNDVWEIVPRLEGKFAVSSKWIYKIKHVADGSVEKYKARFVARGFS
eukprot:PITA_34302